jgi:putative exosortase-associated protein (TIGR04073 family)
MSLVSFSPRAVARVRLLAILAGAAFALGALPNAAVAQEYTAARKLGRGLAGAGGGFLEVPGCITKRYKKQGPAVGFTVGFAEGIGRFALRELVGTYEIVTSWFEIPPGFRPVMQPEFPWGYFDGSSERSRTEYGSARARSGSGSRARRSSSSASGDF